VNVPPISSKHIRKRSKCASPAGTTQAKQFVEVPSRNARSN
jgi:hypothetical protein